MFFFRHKHPSALPATIIAVAGLIGMIDAFFLTLEFIQVLLHPGEPTPCTVNTIVSCTLTVQGPFGHYFPGIPNPLWGMLWYSGIVAYGTTRLLGAEFSRKARGFVGVILIAGMLFSYRLYLASVLQLGGVCPFCLISTTASTLISLAFVVDDKSYEDPIMSTRWMQFFRAYQLFSVFAFVVGLPVFLGRGLMEIPDPTQAMTHWSFPVMVTLIFIMATSHIWAYRKTRT